MDLFVTLVSIELRTDLVLQLALADANLAGEIWLNTICPDGIHQGGTSPFTAEQLNLA